MQIPICTLHVYVRRRYFLITVTPDTLDDAISYASQSGIQYITFLDNIWAGAGHYNVSFSWRDLPFVVKRRSTISRSPVNLHHDIFEILERSRGTHMCHKQYRLVLYIAAKARTLAILGSHRILDLVAI